MADLASTIAAGQRPGSAPEYKCPVCGSLECSAAGELGGFALYVCGKCTHSFTPDACLTSADYDTLYGFGDYLRDQIAPLADKRNWRAFTLLPPYQRFLATLGPGQGRSLLDIGCGVGRFCIVARAAGWRAAGIDPSADAVAAGCAAAMLALSTRSLDEIIASEEHYDAVTLFDVIEHLPDPVEMLAKAQQALKPDGRLFVTVPNFECSIMRNTKRPHWLPPVHLQFFSQASFRTAFLSARWRLLGQGVIDSDPPPPAALAWLRWLSRRVRRLPHWPAQLWALAAK